MFQIEFDDYYELLALHRTIMSAKFCENPLIKEVQGSPYVAKVSFKVFDSLVNSLLAVGKVHEADKWRQWQVADMNRDETPLMLEMLNSDAMKSLNIDDRRSFIENFMAPLLLEQDLLNELAVQKS